MDTPATVNATALVKQGQSMTTKQEATYRYKTPSNLKFSALQTKEEEQTKTDPKRASTTEKELNRER